MPSKNATRFSCYGVWAKYIYMKKAGTNILQLPCHLLGSPSPIFSTLRPAWARWWKGGMERGTPKNTLMHCCARRGLENSLVLFWGAFHTLFAASNGLCVCLIHPSTSALMVEDIYNPLRLYIAFSLRRRFPPRPEISLGGIPLFVLWSAALSGLCIFQLRIGADDWGDGKHLSCWPLFTCVTYMLKESWKGNKTFCCASLLFQGCENLFIVQLASCRKKKRSSRPGGRCIEPWASRQLRQLRAIRAITGN